MHKVFQFLILLCFWNPLTVIGQTNDLEDVIYLYDGGIWRGEILERDSTNSYNVKIIIAGGSVVVIKSETVKKITQEKKLANTYYLNTSHYYNFTSIGVLIGDNTYSNTPVGPSFEMANGYRWNSGILTGVNVALEYIDVNFIQFATDVRYDFTKEKITPFAYANGGINIPLAQNVSNIFSDINYNAGATAGGGVGIRARSKENTICFIWSLGYKVNTFSITEILSNDRREVSKYTFQKLNMRIGFAF